MKGYKIINRQIVFEKSFDKAFDSKIINVMKLCKVNGIYFRNNYDIEYNSYYNNSSDTCDLCKYSKFNYQIIELPSLITSIVFGDMFNQPVDNIPWTIKKLTFGPRFNQLVDLLPNSVTHLTLYCNISIQNLPSSITHLALKSQFNQPIDLLPNNILFLEISFPTTINSLPESVQYLELYDSKIIIEKLPNSLTEIVLGSSCKHLLNSVELPLSVQQIKKYNKGMVLPYTINLISMSNRNNHKIF